jgi:hypothetical protein
MRQFALASLLCVIAGCGSNSNNPQDMSLDQGMPDLTMVDLTPPPDQAGIECGNMTCDTSTQECCAKLAGSGLSATCVARGTCNTDGGGADFQCDGPEDCPGDAPPHGGCCVSIAGTFGSDAGTGGAGSSTCGSTCPGSATFDNSTGMFNATTKLCHTKSDCTGYTGTLLGFPAAYGNCCSSTMAGSYRFCFNGAAAAMAGSSFNCTY